MRINWPFRHYQDTTKTVSLSHRVSHFVHLPYFSFLFSHAITVCVRELTIVVHFFFFLFGALFCAYRIADDDKICEAGEWRTRPVNESKNTKIIFSLLFYHSHSRTRLSAFNFFMEQIGDRISFASRNPLLRYHHVLLVRMASRKYIEQSSTSELNSI